MIQFEDVHKSLGDRPILRGLTLHVPKGTTVCLIGGSGQGKSVTLKHIVGLLQPDSGRVIVDGTDVASCGPADLERVRRKIGFCFQNAALLASMTVADNVALPLREHERLADEEVRARTRWALDLVGLEGRGGAMPADLSGGMRKRVGLARAVVLRPEILLYDEPTSGLDPVIANVINDEIRRFQGELGVTSLVVTHDMEAAYRVSDRIAMLYQGRIRAEGTPDEIRKSGDPVVRQFIRGETEGPLTEK